MRQRGIQGRRKQPGEPGGNGAREQPALLTQAVPVHIPGHEESQPTVLPELVRMSLPHQARRGKIVQNREGASPFAYIRFPVPQLMVTYRPARS